MATAQGSDVEMRSRIARHQADRVQRYKDDIRRVITIEEPLDLAQSISKHSNPQTLIVVDCLTLWLTNWLMPAELLLEAESVGSYPSQEKLFLSTLSQSNGPVVIVSNEIGLGVTPLGEQVRHYVDTLGLLNQRVAQVCDTVTLMAAGLPLKLKGAA
jgi:adenosylcobinamide kinase/adenosylcobinamide-phosphate guanylyltransferase